MTTPPTIDDAGRVPEEGDDRADWSLWEQTFRDARPVLPEAAMQRIDQAIKLEVQRAAPANTRPRRWLLVLTGLLVVIAAAIWILMPRFNIRPTPAVAPTIEERFPLTFSTGPRRVGPTTSALPLAEERQVIIVATGKSVDQGIATYRGPVRVTIGARRIACDTLTVFHGSDAESRLLSGKGNVHGENVLAVGAVSADEFTFNTGTGILTFTGNVHSSIDGKPAVAASLTISPDGTVEAAPH
jgi:LptA/(LptD N-terminal domain) LPS transport protein